MPTHRLQRGLRATFFGMAVNIFLAGVKFVAGVLGNSHALVADAVESFADIFSSLIVWRGLVIAETPPDEDHPYGHGKAEPIAAAIVATFLLLAAAGIAMTSLRAFFQPHEAPKPFTLLVLVVVVVIKECLYRFVSNEARVMESSAVHSDAWHHRSDAITSLAAALGISAALIGGKGWESADDAAAFVAAGIIAWNGWSLLKPALGELMDTVPDPTLASRIRQVAAKVEGVAGVEKCLIRKVGWQLFVDLHVEVDPQMTVAHGHAIAHAVKDRIRAELPAVRDVLIHIEPRRDA